MPVIAQCFNFMIIVLKGPWVVFRVVSGEFDKFNRFLYYHLTCWNCQKFLIIWLFWLNKVVLRLGTKEQKQTAARRDLLETADTAPTQTIILAKELHQDSFDLTGIYWLSQGLSVKFSQASK